jgi:hypothetical protein
MRLVLEWVAFQLLVLTLVVVAAIVLCMAFKALMGLAEVLRVILVAR